jgi:outer membrane protein
MKFKFLIIMILVTVRSVVFSQEKDSVYTLSLERAQQLALQRNKTVLNSELDIIKAKKKIWETTAIGLPQVNGSFSHNYNIDLPVTLIPAQMFNPQAPPGTYMEMKFGTEHNTKAGLSVSQLIFSGQYLVGLQTTRVFKQLAETKSKQTQRDVKYSVAQTYYLVLITAENKKILDSNYVFINKLYEDTKKMYKAGLTDKATLKQMELNKTNMENAKNALSRQYEIAQNLLKFQIGIDLNSKIELTGSLSDMNSDIMNATQLIESEVDAEQTLDYQLVETQEKLQQLALKNEKAALLPTISAFYNHQESMMGDKIKWFDEDGKWYKANIVGFTINVPIFGSGQKLAKISQAKIELEKTRNQKWMMKQNLTLQILQAKVKLQNAMEKYSSQKQNKELASYIYTTTRQKYLKGMASSMELTQAQMQYFTTLQQYYQAILEYWNAKNELEKLINN